MLIIDRMVIVLLFFALVHQILNAISLNQCFRIIVFNILFDKFKCLFLFYNYGQSHLMNHYPKSLIESTFIKYVRLF